MLQRMVAREVVKPLVAWTLAICALLFMLAFLRASEVLLGSAVARGDILRFAAYSLPGFLAQALPPALLAATLLGLGRLAEDGELKAIQFVGASPLRVLLIPGYLGIGLSLVLVGLTFSVQPAAISAMRIVVQDALRKNLSKDFHAGVFHEEVNGIAFYAAAATEGGGLKEVFLYDDRDAPFLTLARTGTLETRGPSESLGFLLEDGKIYRNEGFYSDVIAFDAAAIRANLARVYQERNQNRVAREEEAPLRLLSMAREANARGMSDRSFLAAFHWRLGQTLMPLSFAFIAGPIALLRRGGQRARSVLLTLAAYAGYFLLARISFQLGNSGALPPVLGGQIPNLVALATGAALYWQAQRRSAP